MASTPPRYLYLRRTDALEHAKLVSSGSPRLSLKCPSRRIQNSIRDSDSESHHVAVESDGAALSGYEEYVTSADAFGPARVLREIGVLQDRPEHHASLDEGER